MKMFLAGEWVERSSKIDVTNPFSGDVFDTVPAASLEDVDTAVMSAQRGFDEMRKLTSFDRYEILMRAVGLISERKEQFAQTITREEGKVITESRGEVDRCIQTMTWSAEEAKRLRGETIPLDAAPGNRGKFGFTVRVPVGIVVAISPFNFPLNLVAHKVGPALAAGNAVIIKPASDTPLSALMLTEALLDAGAPPLAIQCITGSGGSIGDALVANPAVRKITFTGSRDIGERIMKTAGLKKVTMELGANSPVIVLPDADLDKVAKAVASTGFANAGQVCISTQRVIVQKDAYSDLLDALKPAVEGLSYGDPSQDSMVVGPMVRESDAARVDSWIAEAVADGARLVTGGNRQGAVMQPTILADVRPDMRFSRDELFGPGIGVTPASDIDEAIHMANDSNYGLAAAIFTQDIDKAMRFALEVEAGNLNVNAGTQFRADMMPYGGLKESGFGKEGPGYAVEEMTELKMVIFHG